MNRINNTSKNNLMMLLALTTILTACGEKTVDDPRVCLVPMSFVRTDKPPLGDSRSTTDASAILVFQGELDKRCVHLIEGASGGYSYSVAAGSMSQDSYLKAVDFGGNRTDSFARTSANAGTPKGFAQTFDRVADAPSSSPTQGTTNTTTAKKYALPWLDGTRKFEVRFESPAMAAPETYPTGVSVTLRLPDPAQTAEKK
jgi:hypothetical protein